MRRRRDVVEELERGDKPLQVRLEDKIVRRVCKTASVKAGQTLSQQEMEAMIRQLELCHSPHTCPHGRPTLIHLSVAQSTSAAGSRQRRLSCGISAGWQTNSPFACPPASGLAITLAGGTPGRSTPQSGVKPKRR